ncbi:cell division protein FtsX [Allopusillimonas ginsengisoli]|uniref:cell division protein FtsX n=1 Tax=Allopusillimonas ginsengisoli TaxID=453575 RepID=UPI0010C204CA|nr:ABC transporter permease [Allopusillimonas ginsengisoli]
MKRWIRQHHYALRVAVRRLLSNPFSSLSNILVISLALTVPILAASVLVSAQPVVREIPVSPELTLFLSPTAPEEAAKALSKTLQGDYASEILAVRVVTRAQALTRLKSNPSWQQALSVLPDNPLPDAVVVTLRTSEGQELHRVADSLARQWRTLDHVDTVQLDSEWVRRLEAILRFTRLCLALLAVGVALVVLATVFNTVRMQALTQRDEIGVARLVGATESFVRRPFLYLGALTGFISSAVAIGLTLAALYPINAALLKLAASYSTQFVLQLPDFLSLLMSAVVVAILGALSARWSVTRNTRF